MKNNYNVNKRTKKILKNKSNLKRKTYKNK